jgi:hypothetical protein
LAPSPVENTARSEVRCWLASARSRPNRTQPKASRGPSEAKPIYATHTKPDEN